jgi:hypothetical protein
MSRWLQRVGADGGAHARAHELAAQRLDGPLSQGDDAWLTQHLEACDRCRSVAAEYEVQRSALRALRDAQPEPPRDLWARTSAAIDAGARRRVPAAGRVRLPLAPLAGLLVVALAVAGVLNGRSPLLPGPGGVAQATPITLPGGVLQVISRGEDGSVEILSRQLDQVCPMESTGCGLSSSMDVTQSAMLDGNSRLAAIISPTQDDLVVMERGSGPQRLYVLPVTRADLATPPPDTSTPSATPSDAGSPIPEDTPAATGTRKPTSTASATAKPTEAPSATPSATPSQPASEPPSTASTPTESPGASPSGSPDGSEAPTPAPSVAVSPGPGGALEIASDVTVVGSAAGYSDDGSAFAFSAQPADSSAGPDVYVWRGRDSRAVAVTDDHASVFNGWLGNRLLISRIVDGEPVTVVLDPETGDETHVGGSSMWRPTVSPDGRVAAWWDGTVKPVDDGRVWAPDKGRLVLGPWPDGGTDVQVLADGPVGDWEVRWDQDSSVIAVWVSDGGSDDVGQLSLYPVDRATGLADLKNPVLDSTPAYDSISLRPGHLAWSAPDAGGDTRVNVLAWQGSTLGRLQLSTIPGASVVR